MKGLSSYVQLPFRQHRSVAPGYVGTRFKKAHNVGDVDCPYCWDAAAATGWAWLFSQTPNPNWFSRRFHAPHTQVAYGHLFLSSFEFPAYQFSSPQSAQGGYVLFLQC